QRQRHADRVVEVASRGEHVVGTRRLAEDSGDHFLRARLAVAADDGGERQVEAGAPMGRERAERHQRIGDGDDAAGNAARTMVGDECRGGPGGERSVDVVVAVEALAGERHEEIARRDRTTIRRDPRKDDGGPEGTTGDGARGSDRIHHAALHAASAAAASAASENGARTPCASWYVSCPLPATSTTSPGRA